MFAVNIQAHKPQKKRYKNMTATLFNRVLINNQDLLYSTGNYTQYFVITYKGKESEKDIYI